MKIFENLPSNVRRALARKELARRGQLGPSDEEVRTILRHATDADLARMDEVMAPYEHLPQEVWPPEIVAECNDIFSEMVRHAHAATRDLPIPLETREEEDARCELLAQKLENQQAQKATSRA